MENTEEGMPLEELMDVEWLSIRSYNVCKEADLIFLNRILNFYQKHGTFLGYKNCGVKSNRELIEMCIKYLGNSNNQQIQKEDNLRFTLNSFTPYQKSIIIRHFDYLISKLNVRSYKGLMSLSDSNNQHILYEKFLLEDFNFKRLSNIGYKSIQELETIKNELISFIYFIKTLKINELSKEYTKLIVRSNFSNLPKDYEKQFDNFFDENGKIKLFQLLSYIINFGNLFSEVNNKIFEITYSNNEKHKNQESIAKELNLSRERVRQIKLKFEEEIENYFLFISNLKMDDLVNYNIDGVNSVITIDNFFSEDINNTEGVNFNIKFYVKIFGILLRNTHTILNDYILIDGKRKSQIPHKSCYLINKSL